MQNMNSISTKRRLQKYLPACQRHSGGDVVADIAQGLLLDCIDEYTRSNNENAKALLLYEKTPEMLATLSGGQIEWDQIPFYAAMNNQVKVPSGIPTHEYAILLSNLAFDWLDAGLFIRQLSDLLAADGVFCFTSFGAGTALNSRTILAELDDYAHFNDFYELQDIGDALLGAGFKDVSLSSSFINLEYTSLDVLLADARRIFGVNLNPKQRKTLGGRGVFEAFKERVRKIICEQGVFTEQLEIVVAHGRKAELADFGGVIPVRMEGKY